MSQQKMSGPRHGDQHIVLLSLTLKAHVGQDRAPWACRHTTGTHNVSGSGSEAHMYQSLWQFVLSCWGCLQQILSLAASTLLLRLFQVKKAELSPPFMVSLCDGVCDKPSVCYTQWTTQLFGFFFPARWYKVNPINWLLLLRYSAGARFAVPVLAEQISVFKIPCAIVGVTLCNLRAD